MGATADYERWVDAVQRAIDASRDAAELHAHTADRFAANGRVEAAQQQRTLADHAQRWHDHLVQTLQLGRARRRYGT